jgi:5'-methylthioadenosine phosphorylase
LEQKERLISMAQAERAEVGIFGGSGFYSFAEGAVEEVWIDTPYGPPSDRVALCSIAGRKIAFLPRHGREHTLPPHAVNYRANIWAFHSLGIQRVIAPSAVGSLNAQIHPGAFVVNDQFVDRTSGRRDTFYDGPAVTHISTAEPYCPHLRALAIETITEQNIPVRGSGTVVVIQGPRFSTKAESRWFTSMGWDIVNMTQYPEIVLARELGMCYVTISLVTDYDAGVTADGQTHVEAVDVVAVLKKNTENIKAVLGAMLKRLPMERTCDCAKALDFARIG